VATGSSPGNSVFFYGNGVVAMVTSSPVQRRRHHDDRERAEVLCGEEEHRKRLAQAGPLQQRHAHSAAAHAPLSRIRQMAPVCTPRSTAAPRPTSSPARRISNTHTHACTPAVKKDKGSPYSIAERRVPTLMPVLGSQPAGDVSHKPGGRLPLLSVRPAVTLVTLNRAATNLTAW